MILVHCLLTMHVDDGLGGCNLGNFLSFLDLSGESLLAKHELTTSNSIVTPLDPLHSPGCEDNSYPAVENFTWCQHLISPLLLSQLNSRPDISFAVPLLSQICSALLPQHYAVSRRVIRHPNGTKSFRLTSIDFDSCLVSISSCYFDCISTSALSLASNHSFIHSHIKSGDFDIIHIDLLPGFKRHFRHLHRIFSNFCRYCTVFKVDVPSFASFFPVSQPQKCNTCVSHALLDVILAHAYWFQFSAELLSCDFMAFHCQLTVVTSFQRHCSFSSSTSCPHAIHLDSSRSRLFKLDNPRNMKHHGHALPSPPRLSFSYGWFHPSLLTIVIVLYSLFFLSFPLMKGVIILLSGRSLRGCVEMVSCDSSSATSIIVHLFISSLFFISLLSFMHGHLGPKPLSISFIKLCLAVWYLSLSLSCWGIVFSPFSLIIYLLFCS